VVTTIFDELDREWARETARPHPRRPWATDPVLATWPGPGAVVAFAHERDHPEATDAVLAALAARAGDDVLAARTLLAALMPGLRRVARDLGYLADRAEVASVVASTAWERIRTYPIERRPARIAANVVLDTRRRAGRTLRANAPLVAGDGDHPEPPDPGPQDGPPERDLASLLEAALGEGVVAREDVALITTTRVGGVSLATLAAAGDDSYDRLRQRRRRAEQRLAAWARRRNGPC